VPDLGDLERRSRQMTILAVESGQHRILGTVAYQALEPGEGHLRGMAVLPRSQGKGLGKLLLRAAEAELQGTGCTRVTLDTTPPLQRAIRFYERHGYRHTGVVRDYFGVPLFEYEKALEGEAG
jgi:ribosomal protein S18 acetylase RimI-like enzyme